MTVLDMAECIHSFMVAVTLESGKEPLQSRESLSDAACAQSTDQSLVVTMQHCASFPGLSPAPAPLRNECLAPQNTDRKAELQTTGKHSNTASMGGPFRTAVESLNEQNEAAG